ncbi:MAG: IPT/TIG domain-containing protein [Ignavibacteria bacterium]|nr:IPT/TIG domain-containing protein [Ignavibacteria bacterium]
MRRTVSTSLRTFIVLLCLFVSVPLAFAAPITWVGGGTNSWTDPMNWSPTPPIPNDDVTIVVPALLTITDVPSIVLNSLTISAAAPLSLQSVGPQTITITSSLNIGGTDVTTIGNQLTLESSVTCVGDIAVGSTLNIAGTLEVFANFTNNGTCNVVSGGTLWMKSVGASVSGQDVGYMPGSLLRYEYAVGAISPNTGAELPTLPNVMNGNVTVDVPSAVTYLMTGDKHIIGTCSFTHGNWNLNGYNLQLDGPITIAWINHSFIGNAASSLTVDGTGAIVGSMGFNGSYDLQNLTMNRAGATLRLVSASPLNIANSLNLLAGNIDCAIYNVILHVQNPLSTAVTGGNSGSYVITSPGSGLLRRAIPFGVSPNAYKFPVGTVSGYFPFTLLSPDAGGLINLDVSATDVVPSAPIVSSHYLTVSQGGGTALQGQVLLESPLVQAGSSVAANTGSPTPLSSYSSLGSSPVIPGVSAQTSVIVSNIGTFGPYYFALAGAPAPPYVWAGAPGANWQAPSSWSPPRNNPAVTDELVFNAGTHTPTNVPHETVSQLTIKDGATVTLSASNPNNWLTTTAMPYGVIVENGGKLDLGAPATNIALNIASGSQCRIYGTLQTQNSAVIGDGFFSLENDALLATTRDDGINGASVSGGAVQTAVANYHSQARYEFTSASLGAERDMNFKSQGGKSGITSMRALYVRPSAGTRRLNSAITVGGMALLALSKGESTVQSIASSTPEVVIQGRTTLHSAMNSSLSLTMETPLTVSDGAELWNNGQISYSPTSRISVNNAFLTMVGPNGGAGNGTGTFIGSGSSVNYTGASMLSYTGGGTFTTSDFILPPSMSALVSVSNASVVSLNSSKTLQAGLQLLSDGKMALNNQRLTVNNLTTSSGGAFRGTSLSALTLNGVVSGGLAFESGFGSLNSLTLNYAQTSVPSLSGTLDVVNTLTLQNGILTVAAPNALMLSNAAPSSLSGSSSTSYIRGALRRIMQANVSADGQSYVFPVGDSEYRPFTLANVRTGTAQPTVLGQSFPSGSGTWTPPLTSGAAYNWLAQTLSGDFLTGTFQVGSAQSPIPAGLRIATAIVQVGGYGDIGADDVSPVRSSLPQAATASASGTYFALGGAVPSVIRFAPRVARPGQVVTLEGTFLSSVTGVSFGGVPAASFTVVSPTQITAVVGNSGASGAVQVQSPLGTVAAPLSFTWMGQPTITSIAPSLNVVGQTITIRGSEYHPTPFVSIGTQLASSVTAASLTELRVVFAQATTGVLNIIASGGTVSWQQPLTVYASPTLTSLSTMQPLPGTLFTVLGTNFVQGQTQVSIGSVPVQATVNSPTQMTLVAPQSANGLLQITTPAGTVLSSTAIVIIPPPTIASALPNEPQVGDVIALVGTNYVNVQSVSIGGIPATFTVNSPTSISAIAPPFSAASPTSSATVSVTTRSGTAVYSRSLTLRQPPEPVMTLTGFAPQSVVEGQSVTVTGLNVPENALVRLRSAFASVPATAQIQTANNATSTITFNVPVGLIPPAMASTQATITAEAVFPSGVKTAQAALPLTIRAIDAPALTGFSPTIGGARTTLIIAGQNFGVGLRGSIQAVFIGGVAVQSFTVLSPTQIRVTVGQAASGSLTIQTGSGVLTTSARFTFNPLLDAEPVAPSDSLALNALYNATNGALWTTSTNWTNGYPVALRFGVKVERGRVVELTLPANNLDSIVPWTALANLTALRVLNLSGNRLQGALSQNICSMASLKTLNLAGNRFEGGVEALCCLPTGLESLNISNNQLFGFLPECLGGIGNLQTFDASGNRFIGGFPVFLMRLPQLQTLNLRGNRLSGILPPSLGVVALTAAKAKNSALTAVESLQRLDISGNDFSGNVPAEIGNLTGLRELYMDGNRFTGAVPESFTMLKRLETLNLAGNSFDALPDLANPIPRLVLNVSGNRLPFADLERLTALQNFIYAPQSITPPRLADTSAVIDAPFTLRAALSGTNNRYQWRKTGAPVQTISADDALRFVAFAPADSGAYQCIITSTKLPLLTVSTASIRVQAVLPMSVPDSVALISPIAAEADVPTLPLFVWRGASGAGQYRVELSLNADFSGILTTLTVAQTASAIASGRMELDSRGLNGFPLQNQTRYFWRVRAENALGAGSWIRGDFTTAANNTLGAMRLDFGKVPRRDTAFGVLTLRNLSAAPIRLLGDIITSNPAFVCESLSNAEIPAESSLQVRVRFVPSVLESVSAALTVRFAALGSGSALEQTQTIANRLVGRGGALKLIPPSIDTSLIGTTKLLAVQVVNVGDRVTELVRVDLRRGTREYSFRADLGGNVFVGVGDTTAVPLRFVAERTGAASAQEVSCQATTDTVTAALVQYGRTKQPTDVVARLGLRAVPESAPPGSEVMLELYLEGTISEDRDKLLRFGIPSFTAVVRFNRNVLALGSSTFVRPIRNTAPDNVFQRCAVPQTFWNGRDVVLLRIPCRAVAGNTDATALVLEQFQWGDGALQVSDVLEGNFKAKTSQAGGKRFISSATAALALVRVAPNPSADVLEVAYTLGSDAWTDISLLDMRGNIVQILTKGFKQAGEQSVQASVKQLPSGTYLLRMESGGEVVMQRVGIVR